MAGVSVETRAPDGKVISFAVINLSASGSIVAGVAGQTIRVYRLFMSVNTVTNTVQFTDGTTNFTGVMTLAQGTPLNLNFDGTPWFTCAVGNGFSVVLAGGQTSGALYF